MSAISLRGELVGHTDWVTSIACPHHDAELPNMIISRRATSRASCGT